MLCVFQEGEEGKDEEEKENLGKLEYSLDYSFSDNQVHTYTPIDNILQAYTPISNLPNTEMVKKCNNKDPTKIMPF